MSGIIVINQRYYIGSNIFVLTYNELKKNIITLCRKVFSQWKRILKVI